MLTERLAKPEGRSFPFKLPGLLSECDVVNGNNRLYPEPVWKKNLEENSPFRKRLSEKAAWGLLEHPKDGTVNLNSPICWVLTECHMEGKKVCGEVTLTNTPEGHKMLALIEVGYNPLVSSRGFGSLVKRDDGVDIVQEDYVCEGWDGVSQPSFGNARLDGQMLRKGGEKTTDAVVPARKGTTAAELFAAMNGYKAEGLLKADIRLEGDQVILEYEQHGGPKLNVGPGKEQVQAGIVPPQNPPPVPPTLTAADKAKDQPQHEINKENQMEKLNDIRESLNSLSAIDPSKLEPARLAAGLTQLQGLHRQAAVLLAEDTKSSWDIDQLHSEITAVETAWKTAAAAPKLEASKLTEAQGKIIKALHATATLAMKYRDKLGESIKEGVQLKSDRKTAVERGKGWMARCQATEEELETATRRLDLCYEGLDEFTRRYNEDVTALAQRVLILEFATQVNANPKVLEAINAATKPAELIPIREQLEGKIDAEGKPIEKPAEKKTDEKPADKPAEKVAESTDKKEVTVVKADAKKDDKPVTTTLSTFKRAFSVKESIDSTNRLSEAYKESTALKTVVVPVLS